MNTLRLSALIAFAVIQLNVSETVRAEDTPATSRNEKSLVNVCIVSGEHLQPGEIVTYVYKESGHPDRTIRFCCRKCLARFKADPDTYLKKLDQLEADKREKSQNLKEQ